MKLFSKTKSVIQIIFCVFALQILSGCVAIAVVDTAIDATTTVVGGAIDVVDAVTPDIISDDDDDNEE